MCRLCVNGKITRQEEGLISPSEKVSKNQKKNPQNIKNLMQFSILFEIKVLDLDAPYFIPLSSSLIFSHFPHTEFQSGITAVAGTN